MKFSELQRLQRREGITVLSADERIEQLEARLRTITKERDALRAKVERMERQEPVARFNWNKGKLEWLRPWNYSIMNMKPLYLAPGAQPAPSVPDDVIKQGLKELEAIRQNSEMGDWQPNDKNLVRRLYQAMVAYGVQQAPSVPEGWLRAIDEALVIAHIGVANAHDTYEQAKAKLDNLIGLHVDIATDPDVNGGYKLVPIEPTPGMIDAAEYVDWGDADVRGSCINAWDRMLAAAPKPEAKP